MGRLKIGTGLSLFFYSFIFGNPYRLFLTWGNIWNSFSQNVTQCLPVNSWRQHRPSGPPLFCTFIPTSINACFPSAGMGKQACQTPETDRFFVVKIFQDPRSGPETFRPFSGGQCHEEELSFFSVSRQPLSCHHGPYPVFFLGAPGSRKEIGRAHV